MRQDQSQAFELEGWRYTLTLTKLHNKLADRDVAMFTLTEVGRPERQAVSGAATRR
jgi:hypothetical protein